MLDEIVNRCSCGIQYTEESFRALPLPYSGEELQEMPDDGDPVRFCLYRNCACGSTILIGLDENKEYLAEEK